MKKIDQLIWINRVCDVFEADLKSGGGISIEEMLSADYVQVHGVEFVDALLAELIALEIVYSADRASKAELLKSKFPGLVDEIESAIRQPKLYDEVVEDD